MDQDPIGRNWCDVHQFGFAPLVLNDIFARKAEAAEGLDTLPSASDLVEVMVHEF